MEWVAQAYETVLTIVSMRSFNLGLSAGEVCTALCEVFEDNGGKLPFELSELVRKVREWPAMIKRFPAAQQDALRQMGLAGWIRNRGWAATLGGAPDSFVKNPPAFNRQAKFPNIARSIWRDLMLMDATDEQLKYLDDNWVRCREEYGRDGKETAPQWWAWVKEDMAHFKALAAQEPPRVDEL